MSRKLVTVITASSGNPLLLNNIKSVHNQDHDSIQHIVFIDGPGALEKIKAHNPEVLDYGHSCVDFIELPYSVGRDRWNGHRMYAAGCYFAEGNYVMFLDDDNTIAPNHMLTCLERVKNGSDWTFALRNIVDKDGNEICQDNCESLGEYPSIINDQDYFIDLNCYFLPKLMAIQLSPLMYRKFREPGQPEIDRLLCHVLRNNFKNFKGTRQYTVNYTVGNTERSVQKDFFINGNKVMLEKYKGELPWKK